MIDAKSYANSIALFLICMTLTVGAILSFPLYDDGWLALAMRELTPHSLAQNMADRPIFGFVLEKLVRFGSHTIGFVLLNAILWLALATESGMLFQKLFPEFRDYSNLAACATLAPIVVQTQLSTVIVSIPANLAAILSYSAVLLLLKEDFADNAVPPMALGSAAVLAALAVMLSEYGVATNLVGLITLLGADFTRSGHIARRKILVPAMLLLIVTVAGYVLFTKVADFSARPDVSPTHIVHHSLFKWMEVPFDVITGAWYSWIAAYAIEIGRITVGWDSKSTIIGMFFGLVIATLLSLGTQDTTTRLPAGEQPARLTGRLAFLSLGLLIGLLPFKAMGRPTTLLEYGSRFRIPILPIAAALTVALALTLVRRQARWVVVVMLGFVIGYSSWTFSYEAIQKHRTIGSYGAAMKPYVSRSTANTVVIVPLNRFESELTATATSGWSLELEKKLWVIGEGSARMQFGNRSACREDIMLDVHMRGLTRLGKIDQLLWLEFEPGKPVFIEPYCLSAK